jgi:peptidoglycan hydrolase-like protein with peptidoglycan-binding domain
MMIRKYTTCLLLLSVVILVASFFMNASYLQASTCLQLNSDLSYGMSDQSPSQSIYLLQEYLHGFGYLTATPNSHFGSATLSAVKTFQTANSISSTGYVGPLTRAAINKKTCGASAATSVVTPTVQSTLPTQTSVPEVFNANVTSPTTGQVLSVGSSTVIRWNSTPPNTYDINLEQPGGAGAGFIAMSQSANTNSNQYVWNVGKIFTSQSNSYHILSTGTYRIRLQSSVSGVSTSDQTSGWFTIVVQQFAVNSVVPSSAYADNATSVVLFGTGFTNSTSVYFDSNYSSLRTNNQYVSSDGTVLVFTIPTTVPPGSRTLYINNNGYNSSPITIPFTVLNIQ